ncbi:carbohydrate ABC transporter permease [Tessaracoccus sp. Z1128]
MSTHVESRKRRGNRIPLLAPLSFTIITMVLFVLFFVMPGGLGIYYAFTDYRGIGSAEWIGLENFVELFQDEDFYSALFRTLTYAVVVVPLGFVVSLLSAWLITSPRTKGAGVARVIFFLPWLVSPIVAGVIWRWLFGESFGLVNYLLSLVGIAPISWQSNANLSLSVVVLAGIWGGMAFSMLLFAAALKNIPQSYYEAASIDGASTWQQFWKITLPLLKPTSFMVVLLSTIGAMKEFALIQALNGGGPGTQNNLMVQYIYSTGFERAKIGYASAASVILMLLLLVIAGIQMQFDKGAEYE